MKVIKSEEQYQEYLNWVDELFDKQLSPDSKDGEMLQVALLLIKQYEDANYSVPMPDPIEAIKFRMEQMGYTQSDLAKVVGLKSRASEILNRKRKLTLEMIRLLHDNLKIPTEVLVQAYN